MLSNYAENMWFRIGVIFLILIATFGMTISIGNYGIFVLFIPLAIGLYYNNSNHKTSVDLPKFTIYIYSIYIVIYWFCSYMNGDGDFSRVSLTINYIVCILSFLIIGQFAKTYGILKLIINILCICVIVDCIITLLQYINNPVGWGIWYIFNDSNTVKQAMFITQMGVSAQEYSSAHVFCPGIFPSQVLNGYIVSSLGILLLYKTIYERMLYLRIISFFALTLILITLFVIQQRMAFLTFCIISFIAIFSRYKMLSILLVVFSVIYFYDYGMELTERITGRLFNFEDNSREYIYEKGLTYITENIMWGGRLGFIQITNKSIHNVILNSFLYGGIIGSICITIIYIKMCWGALKTIITGRRTAAVLSKSFASALLIYNLISLTHNNSLLTGDPIIWILYAGLLRSKQLSNEAK